MEKLNMTANNQRGKTKSGRIMSIDAFRGLAIAIMLFVGNPESPAQVNPYIAHAAWNGLNLADYAFPFFIFICGIPLPISVRKRMEKGISKQKILFHIICRSLAIFLTGLFLNGFPEFNLADIRIPGVLQRIAVVYLIAGIIVLQGNVIAEAVSAIFVMILYFVLMKFVNVPGFGAGILQMNGNLAQYIDCMLLKGHMYSPTFDPEGILSTFSSISTILFGVLCGELLISKKLGRSAAAKRIIILAAAGVVFMMAGNYADRWFPLNKKLWSSSFVLYTSGVSFLIMCFLYILMDIMGYTSIFTPLIILGGSSIIVYIGSELALKTIWTISIPVYSKISMPLAQWLCIPMITPWAGSYDLYFFSIGYILLWVLIVRGIQKFFNSTSL